MKLNKFMNYLVFLIINIVFLFNVITSGFAAPTTQIKIANQSSLLVKYPSLKKYENTFFNVSVVPFYKNCENDNVSINVLLCNTYNDMVIRFSNLTNIISNEEIDKELKEYETDAAVNSFCSQISSIVPENSTFPETTESVRTLHQFFRNNNLLCPKYCIDVDFSSTKMSISPICILIAWGYKYVEENKAGPKASLENMLENSGLNITNVAPTPNQPKKPKGEITQTNSNTTAKDPHDVQTHTETDQKVSSTGLVLKPQLENQTPQKTELPAQTSQTSSNKTVTNPNNATKNQTSKTLPTNVAPKGELSTSPTNVAVTPEANTADESQDPAFIENQDNTQETDEEGEDYNNDPEDPETGSKNIEKIQQNPIKVIKDNLNVESLPFKENINVDPFVQETDSNFFTYFMFIMFVCVFGYVFYHNKTKVLALVLEGRRSSSSGRGGGLGRKKHTAAYRKLDSNLEEAITSNASGRTTQIIY